MSTVTKQTVQLSGTKTLVDLNGDTVNFAVQFSVVAPNEDAKFKIAIVDQDILDSDLPLEYKDVTGNISGIVSENKNAFKNYYMILKADEEVTVEVELTTTHLKYTPPPPIVQKHAPPQKAESSQLKNIVLILIVVGGACLLYYMYRKRMGEQSAVATSSEIPVIPEISAPSAHSALLERLRAMKAE